MTQNVVVAHYHEIALKGRNRKRFEQVLRLNLQRALGDQVSVRSQEARIFLESELDPDLVAKRAAAVFGVAHAMRVRRMPRDLELVGAHLIDEVKRLRPATFRVTSRRNDKHFALRSIDINRELGRIVHEATGTPVSLSRPEMNIFCYVLEDQILVGAEKIPGLGGLPVGSSGRVAALLSGGIDSPVAAFRMMKRGCHVDFIHFHSHPIVDRTTIDKARELAERLTFWQFTSRLHLVPLAEIQKQVRLKAPEPLRVVLYRRFMVRIAEHLARRHRCRALITGEAVGQVASQTLQNLAVVDSVAHMPILRPLVGMDKQEIVDQAEAMGTYEISIEPDQDCCKLFLPRSPAIFAGFADCEAAEALLEVDELIRDALSRTERERIEL